MGARSNFYVGGVLIKAPGRYWVNTAQVIQGPTSFTFASVRLPGRDGELELPATRRREAAQWTLSVTVLGSSYADFIANKMALESVLDPGGIVEIREVMKTPEGKELGRGLSARGMLVGSTMASPWVGPTDGAELSYDFRIPSGAWTPFGS